MSTSSVLVARALRNADDVLSAARTHRADVLEAAAIAWSVSAEVLSPTYDAAVAALDLAARGLQTAEANRVEELADDDAPRQARDEAEQNLRAVMLRVGSFLQLAFPDHTDLHPGALSPMGAQLLLDAKNLVQRLNNTERTAPLDLTGSTVSTTHLAGMLEAAADRYRAAVAAVADEAQELAAALGARDSAMVRFRSAYRSTGLVLEGYFRAANLPHLAARIRPTDRRTTGQSSTQPEAPAEPDTE